MTLFAAQILGALLCLTRKAVMANQQAEPLDQKDEAQGQGAPILREHHEQIEPIKAIFDLCGIILGVLCLL